MPESPFAAKSAPLPAITRRGLLAGTASLAVPALGPVVPPSAHPTQDDAELTALGARFEQALSVHHAAQRALNDCERRYVEEGPDPPPILTSAGPFGHLLADEKTWWSARALRTLMSHTTHHDVWGDAYAALQAAITYEARDRRFRRRIGLRAAECAYRAAIDVMEALSLQIFAAPARTLTGLAIKGRTVKAWGRPEWWSREPWDTDIYERLAAEVIDQVIHIGGPIVRTYSAKGDASHAECTPSAKVLLCR